MSEALKVACASLKIQSGQCTIVPNYKCKAEQSELVKSIETFCLRRNLEIESCIDLWKGKK